MVAAFARDFDICDDLDARRADELWDEWRRDSRRSGLLEDRASDLRTGRVFESEIDGRTAEPAVVRHLRLVAPLPVNPSPPERRSTIAPTTRPAAPRRSAPAIQRRHRAGAAVFWRRRLAAVGFVCVGVVAASHAGSVFGGNPLASSGHPPRAETYVVQPGDTLWAIAGSHLPSWDRREAVDRLTDRLGRTTIVAGETIPILTER